MNDYKAFFARTDTYTQLQKWYEGVYAEPQEDERPTVEEMLDRIAVIYGEPFVAKARSAAMMAGILNCKAFLKPDPPYPSFDSNLPIAITVNFSCDEASD